MEVNTINYRISERCDKSLVPIPNEGHYFRRRGVKLQLKGLPDVLRHSLSSSPTSRLDSSNWSCSSGSLTVTDRRITYLADYRIQGIETVLFPLGTLSLKGGDAFSHKMVKGTVHVHNTPVSVSFRFSKREDARDFLSYASMLQGSMMAASRLHHIEVDTPDMLTESIDQQPPCYHDVLQLERLPPYTA
ncbi:hypothetical protein K493DRAFT_312294 [Basidiobolus meristosporus CBS 931.73]|uniref:GRAM domain-containing protein n=1 Tax=Basidiobolus meristosporus CBS 931.73 TaxID=1314790 RepID=A0A1Y1YUY7_9FUNG|nr:hypothetical protein K493DRAFT_312294 [Basidiobolus meristosporus CBS 931.73]|eukprot:ORY01789.1 hypothetical protein K493DRAFT_312294 [Basidiobolus meristosporus CBS 931.73]